MSQRIKTHLKRKKIQIVRNSPETPPLPATPGLSYQLKFYGAACSTSHEILGSRQIVFVRDE